MSEDALIRLDNLLRYARKKGWRDKALAEKIGRSPQQLSDMKNNRRGFGEDLARDIEQRLGLPRYWLDTAHDPDPEDGGAQMEAIVEQVQQEIQDADRTKFGPLSMHLATTIQGIQNPETRTKAFAAAVVAIQQVIDQTADVDKRGQ